MTRQSSRVAVRASLGFFLARVPVGVFLNGLASDCLSNDYLSPPFFSPNREASKVVRRVGASEWRAECFRHAGSPFADAQLANRFEDYTPEKREVGLGFVFI